MMTVAKRQPTNSASGEATAVRRPMPKAERREQLLKIAYEIIDRDGIGALTMSALAELSGAAKPVVYEHFGNSQEVIFCLLDGYFKDMSKFVLNRNSGQDNIHAFFDVSIDAMFDFHRQNKFNIKRLTNGFSVHEKSNTLFFEYNKRSVSFYSILLQQQGVDKAEADIAGSILHELMLGTVTDFVWKRNHQSARAVLKKAISGFLAALAPQMTQRPVPPTEVLKLGR